MPKYSKIKKDLNIEVTKPEQTDLAYLTHYLQTYDNGVSHCFKEPAIEYYSKTSKLSSFQSVIPIEWDIPFPPNKNPDFKFIDLFAGIGGIRLAYHNLNGKCVFTSEWNHFAQQTYESNFGEVPFGDIHQFEGREDKIPDHDILLAGFPCQPFSIAGVSKKNSLGKAHGFLDETQGTLFFNIAKILETKRPKAFMLENVKNLYSHDKGKTFKVIKGTLEDDLQYHVFAQVIDGKHYVPQHRERIFIVGFDKKVYKERPDFKFPESPKEPQGQGQTGTGRRKRRDPRRTKKEGKIAFKGIVRF